MTPLRRLAGLCLLLLASALPAAEPPAIRWTMLNVSPKLEQADCHYLEFPDGLRVLIDAADAGDAPGAALAGLQQLGVTELDLVILSHFHLDHYGRLVDILNAGIRVGRVVLNVPAKEAADREIPWGCRLDHVESVLAELRARQIPYHTPKAGDRPVEMKLADGTTAGIEILCAYNGKDTPIGITDVNDTSIVLRVFLGRTRALFTGDLNHALGKWLAESTVDLRADLHKLPHHGTEAMPPDEFFDRVEARAALVPSPKDLWFSPRSKRARTYHAERKIPAYVSGIHGHVTVRMRADGYTITTER